MNGHCGRSGVTLLVYLSPWTDLSTEGCAPMGAPCGYRLLRRHGIERACLRADPLLSDAGGLEIGRTVGQWMLFEIGDQRFHLTNFSHLSLEDAIR